MKILAISILFLSIFILSGCRKSQTPDQPKETVDPGIIKSQVFLYDQGANFTSWSGMKITLENSNPLVSTVTDSIGRFSLKVDTSLKSFTLVYTKPLYGTYKEYYTRSNDSLYVYQGEFSNYQVKSFIEKGQSTSPNLGQKSTVIVNSLQFSSISSGDLNLNCNVSGAGNVQFFYQKNTPITSFTAIPKTESNMTVAYPVQNGSNNIALYMSTFYSPTLGNMHSGDTVHIIAYGGSNYWNSYFDRATNQFSMPNINLSGNVTPVSFILP